MSTTITLTEGNQNPDPIDWIGGDANIRISGAFNRGTVIAEHSGDEGDTWIPFQDERFHPIHFGGNAAFFAPLSPCKIRMRRISGAPGPVVLDVASLSGE